MVDTPFIFENGASFDAPAAIQRSTLIAWRPAARLAHAIDALWFWRAESGTPLKERLLPTGTMHLFIDLERPDLPAAVAGVQTGWSLVDSSRLCMGAHFRPGGARAFLDGPAGELANRAVSLDLIWGRDAVRLRERIHEAYTPSAKLSLLANALIDRQRDEDRGHPAVEHALDAFQRRPGVRVADVSREAGLSRKRFIPVFRDAVGVTPKRYWRVRRFQRVLRHIRGGSADIWADIAARCGYADQAHLTREFRELAGVTPATYLTIWRSHAVGIQPPSR